MLTTDRQTDKINLPLVHVCGVITVIRVALGYAATCI